MRLSRCAPSTGPALGTESDIDKIKALDERSVVGFLHPPMTAALSQSNALMSSAGHFTCGKVFKTFPNFATSFESLALIGKYLVIVAIANYSV